MRLYVSVALAPGTNASATPPTGNASVFGSLAVAKPPSSIFPNVFSFGGGTCQGFTLDEQVGEFVLTQPNMQIPTRGKPIYSVNEANRWQWDEPLRQYVSEIQSGKGESGAKYTSRCANNNNNKNK